MAWVLYALWLLVLVGGVVVLGCSLKNESATPRLLFSSAIQFVSVMVFLFFSYVFIFNKGSSIAQLDEAGMWSLWYEFWLPGAVIMMLCVLISFVNLLWPPYLSKGAVFFGSKVIVFLASALSFFHVFVNMPDA